VVDELQEDHEKKYLPKCKSLGRSLGLKGLPALQGDRLDSYTEGIRGMYQSMFSKYNTNLQGEVSKELLNAEQSHSVGMKENLQKKIKEISESLWKFTKERESLPEVLVEEKGTWKIHIVLFVISLTDSLFTRRALAIFDQSNPVILFCLLLGLIGFYWFTPIVIVRLFRATKDHKNKVAIWSAVVIILVAIFWAFAAVRASYISTRGDTSLDYIETGSRVPLHPVYFVLINIGFLLISSLVYAFYIPEQSQINLAAKTKALDAKIADLERKLAAAETQLHEMPQKMLQGHQRRADSAAESKRLAERINALYREALSAFSEENVLQRPDHGRPDCFDAPIQDLNLISNNVKNK